MKNHRKVQKQPKPLQQIEIIAYNEEDRKEFITGFRKRKLKLKKDRIEKAINRQKEEKREARRASRKKVSQALPEVERIEQMVRTAPASIETHKKDSGGQVVVTIAEFDTDFEDMLD